MPLVHFHVPDAVTPQMRRTMGDVVYDALRSELGVPEDDRFVVVTSHGGADLQIDPDYLGIERSEHALIIQITLNAGRSGDQKRAFYAAVAEGLHGRAGVRPADVLINLVEVAPENWSFGNGIAQYAPATG
jgi:4-oxalocrotonate tautomerase